MRGRNQWRCWLGSHQPLSGRDTTPTRTASGSSAAMASSCSTPRPASRRSRPRSPPTSCPGATASSPEVAHNRENMKERAKSATAAGYVVVDRDQLVDSELQGYQFGGANVCLIFVDLEAGDGPRLHRHPYEEIFIVLEGQAKFTVGSDTVEAHAGQVLIVQPGIPHKFVNSGDGRLRQVDIHASARFVTEWLPGQRTASKKTSE